MLCCVFFLDKWFRGEVISIFVDDIVIVKFVDCGINEKIFIFVLKLFKDEFVKMLVFVVESSLVNLKLSFDDG